MLLQILIVDDHSVVREGIRALFHSEKGMQICAEAANGYDAIRKAEKFKPDITILDIGMPEMNGLEALRKIRVVCPKTQVLILSMHHSDFLLAESLKAGAKAYVLKDDAGDCLVTAVNALRNHKKYFSPGIRKSKPPKSFPDISTSDVISSHSRLTTREREIVRYIAEGLTSKEVAETLGITIKTVESHRTRIMRKLGVHSVVELVRYAIRNKIVGA